MTRRLGLLSASFLLASLLVGVRAGPVYALCQVNNGANNGTDSGTEFGLVGFPGSDDGPNHDQGTWAPTNNWHDNWLKEWCEPSHDWVYDNFIRWEGARWDKLQANKATRKYAHAIRVADEQRYNSTGAWTSTLPVTNTWIDDIFEQSAQGYEQFWFAVGDVSKIGKAVDYNTRTQWDQELTDLSYIDTVANWTDNFFVTVNWDNIGRMDAKKVNQ